MKKILIIALIVGSLAALGAYLFGGSNPSDAQRGAGTGSASATADGRGSAANQSTSGAQGTSSTTSSAASARAAAATNLLDSPKRKLAAEFDKAADLRALYDKYATSSDPAARYFAAKALVECAEQSRRRGGFNWIQNTRDTRLSTTDPKYAERAAAFDALAVDRCSGFGADQLNPTAISTALAEAAALGDPAARALQLRTDIQQRMLAAMRERRSVTLSPDDLGSIQDAVKSRDPEALRQIGEWSALWNRPDGLRVGADQTVPPNSAWRSAWNLLACDNGANCGGDSRDILMSCAMDGACGAPNMQAYLQQFALSPFHYQEALRYQEMIRSAVEQGRWDWLGLSTPPTLGSRPVGLPTPPSQTPPRK
jgi:hypothetical protein